MFNLPLKIYFRVSHSFNNCLDIVIVFLSQWKCTVKGFSGIQFLPLKVKLAVIFSKVSMAKMANNNYNRNCWKGCTESLVASKMASLLDYEMFCWILGLD